MHRTLHIQLDDGSVFDFILDDEFNPVTYNVNNSFLIVDVTSHLNSNNLIISESRIFFPFSNIVSFSIQSISNLEVKE